MSRRLGSATAVGLEPDRATVADFLAGPVKNALIFSSFGGLSAKAVLKIVSAILEHVLGTR